MSERPRVAVVLFNLGGPDRPEAVRPFLFNLFNDPAIIGLPAPARCPLATLISTTRAKSARANYACMGGGSPCCRRRAGAGRRPGGRAWPSAARRPRRRVFIAMRYWKPLDRPDRQGGRGLRPGRDRAAAALSAVLDHDDGLVAEGLERAPTEGPGRVRRCAAIRTRTAWSRPMSALIQAGEDAAGRLPAVRLLFSAHGLPEKVIAGGDPYQGQIEGTGAAVAERLGGLGRRAGLEGVLPVQGRAAEMDQALDRRTRSPRPAQEGLGVVVVAHRLRLRAHRDPGRAGSRLRRSWPSRSAVRFYLRAPAMGVDRPFIAGLGRLVTGALKKPAGVESGCGGRHLSEDLGQVPGACGGEAA